MEPPDGGRNGRHDGRAEPDEPPGGAWPGDGATAGGAPARSRPWPAGERLADGERPARCADPPTWRCVMTEHRHGRTAPDTPITSRHPMNLSPTACSDTTAPDIGDEIVPGAWETDGGCAIQTKQEQRAERGG